jgi:hypothetical protein
VRRVLIVLSVVVASTHQVMAESNRTLEAELAMISLDSMVCAGRIRSSYALGKTLEEENYLTKSAEIAKLCVTELKSKVIIEKNRLKSRYEADDANMHAIKVWYVRMNQLLDMLETVPENTMEVSKNIQKISDQLVDSLEF